MSTLTFLDLETTGLDSDRHEIWEIGLIHRDHTGHPDAEYRWEIHPSLTTADPMALKISRYYQRAELAHYPVGTVACLQAPHLNDDDPIKGIPPEELASVLASLLDGTHMVGSVPDFDARFLRRFLARYGQCFTAHYHLIDVEALAVGYLHGVTRCAVDQLDAMDRPRDALKQLPHRVASLPWDSEALSRAVGVDPDQFDRHTALGDARWARAIYDAVIGVDIAAVTREAR